MTKRFLDVFDGTLGGPPPLWLMRQAGRYLPEYREVRGRAGSFLNLCYTPELAAEVTLQPIRRFGFDAAILFSDILVVPDALGQGVRFVEGEGPVLDPITCDKEIAGLRLEATREKYARVSETVARVRAGLPEETALIGFCGAPWTVATYMVEGKGSKDQAAARLWAYRDPTGFGKLIDVLVEASIDYLCQQVAAGAEALQIFDTWAASLPDDELERWVVSPTLRIVAGVRDRYPAVPIIGFPRGAAASAVRYVVATGVSGFSCDTAVPLSEMSSLGEALGCVMQGNLDPLLLVSGGPAMKRRVEEILEHMNGRRFVFNLGHGIVPQTPPEHVAQLVALVRKAA